MPALTGAELALLQARPPRHKVQWYLAVAPYGIATYTAQVDDPGDALGQGDMVIPYDNDAGEGTVLEGMTLWVGSAAGLYDYGTVRIKSIDTTADEITVAENDDILWADNMHLTCPGEEGFREIWAKYPRITEAGGVVTFYQDYDNLYDNEGDHLPPKANGGPPGVGWIDPDTGLATLEFVGEDSFASEIGAAIVSHRWLFPGSAPTPPATTNMLLWLDADAITGLNDGDPCPLWEDQSGNGNDATQGVGAEQPIYHTNHVNGRPSIVFDGVNDHFDLPAGFDDFTSGVTIFVVTKPTAVKKWARFIEFENTGSGDNIMFARRDTSDDLRYEVYDGGGATASTAADAITDDEWHIYSVVHQGGVGGAPSACVLYKDGVDVENADTPDVPNNVNRDQNFVARSTFGADDYFEGEIAEIIVYNTALNAATRQIVELYLGQKYGMYYAEEGTHAAPIEITWDTAGFHYVELTVEDDNEVTGTTYIPIWIFEEGVTDPFTDVEVISQEGTRNNGWSARFKVTQTNTAAEDIIYAFPDGALVVLFTVTEYGDTETAISGYTDRGNIRFAGWLAGESLEFDSDDGTAIFDAVSSDGVMRILPGWGFTLEDDPSPADWYEMSDLCVDKALHHLLEYYTTVNQVCHVETVGEGTGRDIAIQSFPDADIYSQVQEHLLGDAMCTLLTDRQGIIRARQDTQMLVDRTGVAIVADLTAADWMDTLVESKPHRDPIGRVRLGGFSYETPYLSEAPGSCPSQNENSMRKDGCILAGQNEANRWSGYLWSLANTDFMDMSMAMSGYWPCFDPALQELIRLTTTDALDRNAWTNKQFVVSEVSFADMPEDSTAVTHLRVNATCEGFTGQTMTVPTTPEPADPIQPTDPTFPPYAPYLGDMRAVMACTISQVGYTDNILRHHVSSVTTGGTVGVALHDNTVDFEILGISVGDTVENLESGLYEFATVTAIVSPTQLTLNWGINLGVGEKYSICGAEWHDVTPALSPTETIHQLKIVDTGTGVSGWLLTNENIWRSTNVLSTASSWSVSLALTTVRAHHADLAGANFAGIDTSEYDADYCIVNLHSTTGNSGFGTVYYDGGWNYSVFPIGGGQGCTHQTMGWSIRINSNTGRIYNSRGAGGACPDGNAMYMYISTDNGATFTRGVDDITGWEWFNTRTRIHTPRGNTNVYSQWRTAGAPPVIQPCISTDGGSTWAHMPIAGYDGDLGWGGGLNGWYDDDDDLLIVMEKIADNIQYLLRNDGGWAEVSPPLHLIFEDIPGLYVGWYAQPPEMWVPDQDTMLLAGVTESGVGGSHDQCRIRYTDDGGTTWLRKMGNWYSVMATWAGDNNFHVDVIPLPKRGDNRD